MERDLAGRREEGGRRREGVNAAELTDRLEPVGLQRVGRGESEWGMGWGGRGGLTCLVAASCIFDSGPSE